MREKRKEWRDKKIGKRRKVKQESESGGCEKQRR